MKTIKCICITKENGILEVYIDGKKEDLSEITDLRISISLKNQTMDVVKLFDSLKIFPK